MRVKFVNHNLSLEDIPVFLAFANSASAARAAECLGMSQPAYNERLRKLDSNFRPSLFARQGNKRVLSEFGKTLAEKIFPFVRDIELCVENTVEEEVGGLQKPLRVAGRNEVFSRFEAGIAGYSSTLLLRSCSSHEALQLVERGDADIAISVVKPSQPNLVSRKIFTSTAVLAVPTRLMQKHRLKAVALTQINGWLEVQKMPWLAYAQEDKLFSEFHEMLGARGCVPDVRIYCDNWPTLWRFVKAGAGCAIVPSAYTEQCDSVVSVAPTPDFQKNPFYFVCQKEKADRPRVREFFALCQKLCLKGSFSV